MKSRLFVTLVMLVGLVSVPVHASTPGILNFEALVNRSDVITLGCCVKVESRWNPERTLIHTYATYRIEQTFKGSPKPDERVVVKALGGSVGRITQTVVGGPRFEKGAAHLLFLKRRHQDGRLWVYGLREGQLAVREGNTRVIQTGLAATKLTSNPSVVKDRWVPLSMVLHLVRDEVKASGKGGK